MAKKKKNKKESDESSDSKDTKKSTKSSKASTKNFYFSNEQETVEAKDRESAQDKL